MSQHRLAAIGIKVRGLSLEEAAAYVGLSPGAFLKCVAAGLYPGAVQQSSERKIWDRVALDRALDTLSGIDGAAASTCNDPSNDDIEGAINRVYPKTVA